jgi:hypothetical protein
MVISPDCTLMIIDEKAVSIEYFYFAGTRLVTSRLTHLASDELAKEVMYRRAQ